MLINRFIYFLGSPLHRKTATHVQEEERRKILKMLVTPQVKNFVQPFVLHLPWVFLPCLCMYIIFFKPKGIQ